MRTFEQAFRKFDLYDESRPPFPWLCGIMANIYRMDMRGKARNAIDFFAEPLPAAVVFDAPGHAVIESRTVYGIEAR